MVFPRASSDRPSPPLRENYIPRRRFTRTHGEWLMASLPRRCGAEALGTFAFVFVGAGSVLSKYFPNADYGILGIAVAHGLVLGVMVTAVMGISGGHLNPAVTLAFLATRRITPAAAAGYILSQLA